MSDTPAVTAIMLIHNAAPGLETAIGSVLAQTFADFELMLVDDASTDDSSRIIAGLGDPRIRIRRHREHLGPGLSLNRAIAEARGTYIAICDADGASRPERFALQVARLESAPEIAILGAGARLSGGQFNAPADDGAIKACLVGTGRSLAWSTLMMRRAFLESSGIIHDLSLDAHEHFGFLVEACLAGARFANLPEVLADVGDVAVDSSDPVRLTCARRVRERLFRRMFPTLTNVETPELTQIFETFQPAALNAFTRRAAIVEKAIADQDGSLGQDTAAVARILLQALRGVAGIYRDNHLFTPAHLEILRAIHSPLVMAHLDVFAP